MDKMSVSSSGESISRASSEEELFDVEDDDTEPVLEVRGAEPYRYELVVDVAAQRENADADRVAVGPMPDSKTDCTRLWHFSVT